MSSHDLSLLERVADRVAVLERGRVEGWVELGGSVDEVSLYRIRASARVPRHLLPKDTVESIGASANWVEYRIRTTPHDMNRILVVLIDSGLVIIEAAREIDPRPRSSTDALGG